MPKRKSKIKGEKLKVEKMKKEQPSRTIAFPLNQASLVAAFEQINLAESYTSLLLGLAVVIVALVLSVTFIKQRNAHRMVQEITSEHTKKTITQVSPARSYAVQDGDDLKDIAKNFYGSADLYLYLAKANKIDNPDMISSGQTLTIPDIDKTKNSMQDPKVHMDKISGNQYTAVSGDTLWDIAVRAYNDGTKWNTIAQANGLDNSDELAPGLALTIPR